MHKKLDIHYLSMTVKHAPARASRLARIIDRLSLRIWLLVNINTLLRIAYNTSDQDGLKVVSMRVSVEARNASKKPEALQQDA